MKQYQDKFRKFPYKRADRIAKEIQKELSDLLTNEVKDPRIGWINISLVVVADDLKNVKVFFTKLSNTNETEMILAGLESANYYLSKTISRALRLKNIPEFTYHYDSAFDHSEKISKLIQDIHQDDDAT